MHNPLTRCQLSVYLSSLLSLLIATLLGFLDDVFDIRWRHKLPIPVIASIPLLMVYYAERGNTHVVVPLPLRSIFGSLLNLGELPTPLSRRMKQRTRNHNRSLVLCLYVAIIHVCHQQYQYPRRYQWF
jgi:UDP-N-acetylmuramyl pentapeptide phosphotransferase/UDP-N-acetylglucosamine-1-phosphate transferase